jgi:hypothetical protein
MNEKLIKQIIGFINGKKNKPTPNVMLRMGWFIWLDCCLYNSGKAHKGKS